MPTYTYRCQSCGHQFDIFQKFADDPLKECPECHGALKKVLHPVGVVFKGSGWYITDSRPQSSENGGSDKPEKSEKSDKADKSDKSEKTAAKDNKSGETAKASTAASSESTTTTAAKSESKPKAAASSDS